MGIRAQREPYVEFLYTHTVTCPLDSVGTAGETKSLPVRIAKSLIEDGWGCLAKDAKPRTKPPVEHPPLQAQEKTVMFKYCQSVTSPLHSAGKVGDVRELPELVAIKLAARNIGTIQEKEDGRSEGQASTGTSKGAAEPETQSDSGPDIQSGDSDKKKTVRHRRSRKSLDSPSGSS